MMKIECPTCRNVNRLSGNLMVTRSEGLEVNCQKCKALIKLYVLTKSGKDSTQQTADDPFGDPIEPNSIDANKNSGDPALKTKILRSLVNLPPMPHIILKAKEIMEDPDSSLRDLAGVIETDQAIVARVLTLANSAYYGVSGMVSSIQHASVLLGQKTLGELITISASSRLLSKRLKGYKVEPELLWKHSLAVAFGSKIIAQQLVPELADDAFIAGLLHDAGKIILDPYVHERHKDFETFLKESNKSFLKAEQEILGFDHAEIMSRATRFWRFSENQSIAIRFHHYPSVSENSRLAHIVHLANHLANTADIEAGGVASEPELEPGAMKYLGISAETLDVILNEVVDSVARLEEEYRGKSS
jgi:HD-like signal output (HDOD) protein